MQKGLEKVLVVHSVFIIMDWLKSEQDIKKKIESDITSKTKVILEPSNYYPQMTVLAKDLIKQSEKEAPGKGKAEMAEYKAGVTTQDKVIDAIRAANFTEIQNVNIRFKRLLQDILLQISDQLGHLFKQEYLKLWLEYKNVRSQLMDKEAKLRVQESIMQAQDQDLRALRNKVTFDIALKKANAKLQAEVTRLESDNSGLEEELNKYRNLYDDLFSKHEALQQVCARLHKEMEDQRRKYELMVSDLEKQLTEYNENNVGFQRAFSELQAQLNRYKELYEKACKRNSDLEEQLRYWKSTHQQRLVDLQNSECRIGSQKNYLFKYRREVEDLKRYKLQGEEASKELVKHKQIMYFMNKRQQQMQQTFDQQIFQEKLKSEQKFQQLDSILKRNTNQKHKNNETDVYYETDLKTKKRQRSNQSFQDELQNYLVSYAKTPTPTQKRFRSESAHRQKLLKADSALGSTKLTRGMTTEIVLPTEYPMYPKVKNFHTES